MKNKAKDIKGMRFGKLVAISFSHKKPRKEAGKGYIHFWNVTCDCGSEKVVSKDKLTSGGLKSCGCGTIEIAKQRLTTHGMAGKRPYFIWIKLKGRCSNKKSISYKNYGARGIKYSTKWNTFEGFWDDMKEGYKDDLSIDRIDNNMGYSKENCRWATNKQQARNKRTNRIVTYRGETKCLVEWSEFLGINYKKIRSRVGRQKTNQINWEHIFKR